MNTMMMSIKGRKALLLGASLLLLPLLLCIINFHSGEMGSRNDRQPELQTFQSGNGWGYRIVLNNKVLINQPTIPVIDTVMPFPDESSAEAIGSLVLDRVNQNRNFSVTKDDLKLLFSYYRN